jgi:transcriptional regulator with XRE-family HTH domain
MAHIGINIAKLRGMRRITQKEMAAKLNLGQPDYSKIEQKAEIDDGLLESIAQALEVSPEAIRNFNEDAAINIISSTLHDNAGSYNSNPVFNFNPIDKIVELYETVINEKNEIIKQKDEVIEMYKKQQKAS